MLLKVVLLYKYLLKRLPLSQANVYNYLWRHYGMNTSKLFGALVKVQIQIYTLNNVIYFITTCKRED